MTIERIDDSSESQPRMDSGKPVSTPMANQFEAVFLQSILKSNCIDQHFTDMPRSTISPCESQLPIGMKEPKESVPENHQPEPEPIKTVDDFVKTIWPYAKQASTLLGLDPKILMAQAALETGWGQFIAKDTDGTSSNNLFNIKANNTEQSIKIKTTEYVTDTPVKMMASFKKYHSIEQSFNDYVSLIQGERYKSALTNTHDPKRYIEALHQSGYATDPDYVDKILSIYQGNELQQALERHGCVI